ncbi:MAG: MGMT family protein [Phycisphaeraceae bacterium]
MNTDPDLSRFESLIKAGRIHDDMNFNERVWALTVRIPRGSVATYASIARKLGSKAYRAVGNALNRNPFAPQVPCHRVVGSDGKLTGFAGGLRKKAAMLREEGIEVRGDKVNVQAHAVKL